MFDILFGESDLILHWPWALLLLPLPFFIKPKEKDHTSALSAPHIPLFRVAQTLEINSELSHEKPAKWRVLLLIAAWLCLVFAAARPTYVGNKVELPQSGRDLMLAIDISPSMKEKDLHLGDTPVTRLDVVKKVVTEFIDNRKGDRLGLILFGSEPYIQSPLSFDMKTLNTLLHEAYLGMAGQATAIGDAIGLGVKRLRERPEQSRVMILLSDGANTAGDIPPEKAAQLAAKEQIKIYTIGIGADEMYKRSFFGSQVVNPSADLDEEMLTEIAVQTGGKYFRARDTKQLREIYSLINELEPIEQDAKTYRPQKALFYYFLAIAVTLCLIQLIVANGLHSGFFSKNSNKHRIQNGEKV